MFDDKGISQSEKREVLRNDQRVRSTYHSFAQADVDLEMGGRFSKVHSTTVTGSTPGPVYPQMPKGNPWRSDPLPQEPSLGYAIDAMEPVGEKFEIEASNAASPPASAVPPVNAVGKSGRHPQVVPATQSFRRRF